MAKFYALFKEDGMSYALSTGEVVNGEITFPQDGANWIEVEDDINKSSVWKKEGNSVSALTEEEIASIKLEMRTKSFMQDIRNERKKLLDLSDWTQFDTTPLSAEKKAEWAVYRQALRDLPDTIEDVTSFVWPTQPA